MTRASPASSCRRAAPRPRSGCCAGGCRGGARRADGGGRGGDRGGGRLLRRRAGRSHRRPRRPRAAGAVLRRVYAAVRRLGWGETTTYGALAKALGAGPEAARDVGQAMARNPVPLIVPCHRVLAAGGKLGGFSAPGGAAAKRRMLELEGVRLSERRRPRSGRSPSEAAPFRRARRRYEGGSAVGEGRGDGDHLAVGLRRAERLRQGSLIRLTVDLHRRAETGRSRTMPTLSGRCSTSCPASPRR